jgi:predicted NBD/HSP70 family sugar kinase
MRAQRVNSALIRRINTARVFHAVRENADISQRRIVQLTGLDAATVSTIVAQLEAEDVLQRLPAAQPSARARQPGRPEAALRIAPQSGWFVGAVLEVDAISLVLAGLDGGAQATLAVASGREPEAAIDGLRQGVDTLLAAQRVPLSAVRGIGICVPGLVDRTGSLVLAPNLGWRDLPVAEVLQARFPVPVHVGNDTKAAARAEYLFGACRGLADFVYIHGHSGIGGALHVQGRVYQGIDGLAGEIGHMKIVPDGRRCACGGLGCLEAYVSEPAILRALAAEGCELADAAAAADRARAGDARVLAVLREAGARLGVGLANLINIMNPQRVVLGGNLATLAEHLLPAARRSLAANVLPAMGRHAELLVSALGAGAVPMGGVALALEAFQPLYPEMPLTHA